VDNDKRNIDIADLGVEALFVSVLKKLAAYTKPEVTFETADTESNTTTFTIQSPLYTLTSIQRTRLRDFYGVTIPSIDYNLPQS